MMRKIRKIVAAWHEGARELLMGRPKNERLQHIEHGANQPALFHLSQVRQSRRGEIH